ncbi:hypothetical protein [Hoeflea sp.]|uniref:hypothetical protein n=1 Tax=Hoeflea sp. TaxID=1940281 RepID=UPI003A90479A
MIIMEFFQCVLNFLSANKDAFIAAGVMIGALTAAGTSWWASRANHKSMVSQMRERWIEALRAEVAELKGMTLLKARKRVDKNFDAYEYLHKSHVIGNRIILRLNPNNESHARLEEAVIRYGMALADSELNPADDELLAAARHVIEQTWLKAERGIL